MSNPGPIQNNFTGGNGFQKIAPGAGGGSLP
jgi:hypothetical protein